MVRAGEDGYLAKDFARGFIGIGWNSLGDLSSVSTQDSIRQLYLANYPNEKPGKANGDVAVIFKFRSVIQMNDKVVTYDPVERRYLIGTVTDEYSYQPGLIRDQNHVRKVKWEEEVGRDDLAVSSRNSLGSTLTLFSVNEDVWADILRVLSGKPAVDQQERVEEEKQELELIREDIINRAHELIKDKILKLADDELEKLSAAILRAMGYKTRISPKGPDRGVDVFASPDGLGLEEPRIKVEVKHRPKETMKAQDIRSFLGGLRQGDRALYVSTGGFTKDAKYEADRSNIPVTLLSLDDLATLIVTHYENFDLEGRSLISLIRVYWPTE
ncbi:MAG: restriction endonuclease [Acidobacteria bacterium]|nr:MAG: restriction endonuclease [Acidobacteriota bacterium]